MLKRSIKLMVLAFINALAYHMVYVLYLYPTFGYADFRYTPPSSAYLFFSYFITVLPVIGARNSNSPAAVGCALIYAISYVPIQLTLTFILTEENQQLFTIQLLLALSMVALFRSAAPAKGVLVKSIASSGAFAHICPAVVLIHTLMMIGLTIIYFEYGSIMRFASFDAIYDLRSEASELVKSVSTGYLMMWITSCLGPFYIARAFWGGNKLDMLIGVTSLIFVYLSVGAKGALLTPLIMLLIWYIDNGKGDFLARFLGVVGLSVILIIFIIPVDGTLGWIKSIIFGRIFGSNGWLHAAYYEYFSSNGFTFYTHIGPVNAIFGGYPYGEKSLGQEIVSYYFPGTYGNYNAGFWASDAFAALGVAGIPIITLFIAVFMRKLDNLATGYPPRFINLWLIGFWMTVLNVPFSTALLSGGGLLIMLLLKLGQYNFKGVNTKIQ